MMEKRDARVNMILDERKRNQKERLLARICEPGRGPPRSTGTVILGRPRDCRKSSCSMASRMSSCRRSPSRMALSRARRATCSRNPTNSSFIARRHSISSADFPFQGHDTPKSQARKATNMQKRPQMAAATMLFSTEGQSSHGHISARVFILIAT